MFIETRVTAGDPGDPLARALGSKKFSLAILNEVFFKCLGVNDPVEKPAEYGIMIPQRSVSISGATGVAVHINGATMGERQPGQFYATLAKLQSIVKEACIEELRAHVGIYSATFRVFCSIQLDKEVEWPFNSGRYTTLIEGRAELVEYKRDGQEPQHEEGLGVILASGQ